MQSNCRLPVNSWAFRGILVARRLAFIMVQFNQGICIIDVIYVRTALRTLPFLNSLFHRMSDGSEMAAHLAVTEWVFQSR